MSPTQRWPSTRRTSSRRRWSRRSWWTRRASRPRSRRPRPRARRSTTSTSSRVEGWRVTAPVGPCASPSRPKTSGQARRPPAFSLGQKDSLLGYLLVAPVLRCLALLVVYPFLFAIWISFTDRTIGAEGRFIGLGNYVSLLGQ